MYDIDKIAFQILLELSKNSDVKNIIKPWNNRTEIAENMVDLSYEIANEYVRKTEMD